MSIAPYIYFHSPCLDGIVSGVLVSDFLEAIWAWPDPHLQAVDYDVRADWLEKKLHQPCAVVDFLYHPQADFWVDHHPTAFLDSRMEREFKRGRSDNFVYDSGAPSCASLLRRHLKQTFSYSNARYNELVTWATKTDSADYDSVEEAVSGKSPALLLSRGLALGNHDRYCEYLVRELRKRSLAEVATLPRVKERTERITSMMIEGQRRFSESVHLENDGIVVFDVDARDAFVSRYLPFYFYPEARYSAGIVRFINGGKLTVMRNPWREFQSVFLGRICEQFAGGGHERVGSILLGQAKIPAAKKILSEVIAEIRAQDGVPVG